MLEHVASLGLPMGVVTSKSGPMAERGLAISGIRQRFDIVVSCEDTERHKPDPAPLVFAADALGADLRYCVYVGDSPHDMRAAKAAGAHAVGVTWGVSSEAHLAAEGPDAIIDDMADLSKLFMQASARADA
jgi:pyrophosphatase PpaX